MDTCIIIAEVSIDGEILHLGMLADSVQEVIDIDPSQIDPPPKLGSMLNTDFIRGMGKREEGFFIILNIDQVLSSDEMVSIQAVKTASDAEGRGMSRLTACHHRHLRAWRGGGRRIRSSAAIKLIV